MKDIILSKTSIGILIGLLGGLLTIYLMADPLHLGYMGGYLLIIGMTATIFFSTSSFILIGKGKITYWNKVYVGFTSFFVMIFALRIFQGVVKTQAWELNSTDLIFSTILLLIIGFILAMLFARMKIRRNTSKPL